MYQDGNATSEDFRKAMESASGVSLSTFFKQWLYQPGWPEYRISWNWDAVAGEVGLVIHQAQTTGLFDATLDVVFEERDRREAHKIRVFNADQSFRIPLSGRPSSIEIDPDGWLLKTISVQRD